MSKVKVDYGTIRGMVVELPDEGYNCMTLLTAWVKGFIAYMTSSGLVSDDVLCSSIGKSNAFAALVAGIEERTAPDSEARRVFLRHITDEEWRFEVLKQRRGVRVAFADRFGADFAKKAEAAMPDIFQER